MIRENQQLLNRLNVVSDGILIYLMLPLAYWFRFHVMPNGIVTVPLRELMRVGLVFTLVQLFTYAAFQLYQSSRKTRIRDELIRLLEASLLDAMMLLSYLFVGGEDNYSGQHGVHPAAAGEAHAGGHGGRRDPGPAHP